MKPLEISRFSSLSAATARFSLSLRAQIALITIISLAVPILLYAAFEAADADKEALLLDAVRGQDVVIAKAIEPILEKLSPADFERLSGDLGRFASDDTSLKLLFKPNATGGEGGFFYVASAPMLSASDMMAERASLDTLGILDRLGTSCAGNLPLSERVALGSARREILTSVAPLKTEAGCWVLVVAAESQKLLGEVSGLPYWHRPTVRAALLTYIIMALLALVVFGNIWRTLTRFRLVARDIEAGRSFADSTSIPELAPVASDLDRMVGRLNETAGLLRRSAEDNAHAFKTPLAIIRQAHDMLRRPVAPERGQAALDAISASLHRLDGLVRSARRLDVATAELLDFARHPVKLSALVEAFVAEHRLMLADRADSLIANIAPGIVIAGREELVETILENLVENSVSFSKPGDRIFITLAAEGKFARLEVADEGPGVAEDRLERIFDRYHSDRPIPAGQEAEAEHLHYGVGLWVVRQNAGALSSRVVASNRPEGGLVVTVTLPLAY